MKDVRLKLNKRYVFSSDATAKYYKKDFNIVELYINGKLVNRFAKDKLNAKESK